MKAQIGVKTGEFEFIHIDIDESMEDIVQIQRDLKLMVSGGEGLPQKEWNKVLDNYRKTGKLDAEVYAQLNKWQQLVVQELKKSNNRMDELETITCGCEQKCGEGEQGEVEGHIADCSCGECHRLLGKISS